MGEECDTLYRRKKRKTTERFRKKTLKPTHTHTNKNTCARTHARTYTRMYAQPHAHTRDFLVHRKSFLLLSKRGRSSIPPPPHTNGCGPTRTGRGPAEVLAGKEGAVGMVAHRVH